MPLEFVLLVLTAVLAVVAVVAALVAVRASRRTPMRGTHRAAAAGEAPAEPEAAPTIAEPTPSTELALPMMPPEARPLARVVEGRVIVTPTTRQIVEATMSRPLVRVSVVSHGLAHALRPESRDRIIALMRREFRARRRQRKRAARQAARLEHPIRSDPTDPAAITTQAWLGELPPRRQGVIDS